VKLQVMRRDERFAVGERAQLDVEVAAGRLEVIAAGGDEIRVTVESSNADDLDISQIGDTVSIRENTRWLSRSRSIRILVEVPPRAALSIKGSSTDVMLRGALGEVRCRTASGDVRMDDVDRLEVSTASGDIRVRSVTGDASFNTASGDVTVTTAAGRLSAQLASGDLTADAVGSTLDVGTASGDVRIDRCDGSEINIKTVSGDIRLGLPSGIRVDPNIVTMSGKVLLPPPAPKSADSSVERRSVRLRLRTVSGDVRVERVS
jgi:DUF4097 and DUF4098 domain-containing protein YvlB